MSIHYLCNVLCVGLLLDFGGYLEYDESSRQCQVHRATQLMLNKLVWQATYLVLVQEIDSLHQLEHIRLHSHIGDSMWHQFHVMEEGSIHEFKHQV